MEEEQIGNDQIPNMSHTINMEQPSSDASGNENMSESEIANFLSLHNPSRTERQHAVDPVQIRSNNELRHEHHIHRSNPRISIRPWRVNFNHMLPFSAASPSEALLSLFPRAAVFGNSHIVRANAPVNENELRRAISNTTSRESATISNTQRTNPAQDILPPAENGGIVTPNNNRNNTLPNEDDTHFISELFVKILSHFVRYLPFICIIFIKFMYDNLVGILDLVLLQSVMYHVSCSFKVQVSKLSQKSYWILSRDFVILAFIIAYRFLLIDAEPDIFGLLINIPTQKVNASQVTTKPDVNQDIFETILSATQRTSPPPALGLLLYYVAVNDLVIKLATVWFKIFVATIPSKFIRHKRKARMFVLTEYLSQFYRSLAPVKQWILYLFGSYVSFEIITGVFFSATYIGAKCFEFIERGKNLKKALINVVQDIDYERKPTKDEIDAAGILCPICHDAYSSPVVLKCGHIFCDDCVGTWFKREQTCPMCRAKVTEDPTWQDGSTTFFYQLC